MSSRNVYLTPPERASAVALSRALREANDAWRGGEAHAAVLQGIIAARLEPLSADYIAVVDPDELAPVDRVAPGTIIAIAARVGKTRLVDNIILGA